MTREMKSLNSVSKDVEVEAYFCLAYPDPCNPSRHFWRIEHELKCQRSGRVKLETEKGIPHLSDQATYAADTLPEVGNGRAEALH